MIQLERQKLDAAASHGLFGWLWLGDLTDLPPRPPEHAGDREKLLARVVDGLKAHPGSGSGRASTSRAIPPRRPLDPPGGAHPRVRADAAARREAPARDRPGARQHRRAADAVPARARHHRDGYLSRLVPPGIHGGATNKTVTVVGDWARVIAQAAGAKPFWMTLQIAWTGVVAAPATGPPSCHAFRRCSKSVSWRSRRSSTAPAASSSSAAT